MRLERSNLEHLAIGVAMAATLVVAMMMCAGCATVDAVKSNATWQDIAASSCKDLQTASIGASAGVAWCRVYFPDKDELFKRRIEPLLLDLVASTDAYCAAAKLVEGSSSMTELLKKKAEVNVLMDKIAALLQAIKGA